MQFWALPLCMHNNGWQEVGLFLSTERKNKKRRERGTNTQHCWRDQSQWQGHAQACWLQIQKARKHKKQKNEKIQKRRMTREETSVCFQLPLPRVSWGMMGCAGWPHLTPFMRWKVIALAGPMRRRRRGQPGETSKWSTVWCVGKKRSEEVQQRHLGKGEWDRNSWEKKKKLNERLDQKEEIGKEGE